METAEWNGRLLHRLLALLFIIMILMLLLSIINNPLSWKNRKSRIPGPISNIEFTFRAQRGFCLICLIYAKCVAGDKRR